MKIKNILYLMSFMLIVTSCYKDNSAKDFKLINPIKIDLGGVAKSMNVFQNDILNIKPIVYKNGVRDDNMTCEWSVQSSLYPAIVVGNSMELNFKVIMPPNSTAYDLIIKVTDKTTGIVERDRFSVTVNSRYGEGLFVAHTRDELTSDISLLMAMNFSRGVTDETQRVFQDMYSTANNVKIDGIVNRMQSVVKSDSRTMTVLTNNSIHRFDPYDFAAWQRDNEIFFVPYEVMRPVDITKISYGGEEYINLDGKLFYRNPSWANYYFNFHMFTSDLSDYQISKFTTLGSGYYTKKPYAYDELNNRFVNVSGRSDVVQLFVKQNATLLFDVNNIEPSDAILLSEGEDQSLVAVLKSEVTSKYTVYWMQTKEADNGSNLPIGKIDLSNSPEIDRAVGFASSPISKDFYYATDKKIYTVALEAGNVSLSGAVRYEIKPENVNEKITSIMLWKGEYQGMWVTDEKNEQTGLTRQNAQNRMIVITTYDDVKKEGKVITMPIIRTSDGTIDTNPKTHIEYGGFGRITSIEYNQVGS